MGIGISYKMILEGGNNMAYSYFDTGLISMMSGSFGSSSGSFGNSSSFGSIGTNFLSDYASIQNGSYRKLMNAYYNKPANTSSSKAVSDLLKKTEDKSLTAIKSEADSLMSSAGKLTATGSKSLFVKKDITVTDEKTGEKTTTKDYDMDSIAKAVKSFVSDYNDLIGSVSDSDNYSILKKSLMMIQGTASYSKSLESVGISIGADNKLTLDEDKLKSADINNIKSLFNGNNSFAYRTSQRAAMIGQETTKAATSATNYTSSGQYQYYNYYGSAYNAYF
jgi:hypothetical protein